MGVARATTRPGRAQPRGSRSTPPTFSTVTRVPREAVTRSRDRPLPNNPLVNQGAACRPRSRSAHSLRADTSCASSQRPKHGRKQFRWRRVLDHVDLTAHSQMMMRAPTRAPAAKRWGTTAEGSRGSLRTRDGHRLGGIDRGRPMDARQRDLGRRACLDVRGALHHRCCLARRLRGDSARSLRQKRDHRAAMARTGQAWLYPDAGHFRHGTCTIRHRSLGAAQRCNSQI